MTQSLDVHVDESAEAMARRFIDAWHRAERGQAVDEHHLSFESWEGLARVLTGKRLELLRHLHRTPRRASPSWRGRSGATPSACTRMSRLWRRPA
jgi:predicted transcriptional regulator